MLIGAVDLPGSGWVQRDERVFRLGVLGDRTPWGERAGRAGHFAAMRSFEQVSTKAWTVSEVLPLVSIEDASLALRSLSMKNMWRNPKFGGELVEERELENPSVPQVDEVRIILHEAKSSTQRGYTLHAFATVGSVLLFVGVFRTDTPVTIEDVVPAITVQVAKLSA